MLNSEAAVIFLRSGKSLVLKNVADVWSPSVNLSVEQTVFVAAFPNGCPSPKKKKKSLKSVCDRATILMCSCWAEAESQKQQAL